VHAMCVTDVSLPPAAYCCPLLLPTLAPLPCCWPAARQHTTTRATHLCQCSPRPGAPLQGPQGIQLRGAAAGGQGRAAALWGGSEGQGHRVCGGPLWRKGGGGERQGHQCSMDVPSTLFDLSRTPQPVPPTHPTSNHTMACTDTPHKQPTPDHPMCCLPAADTAHILLLPALSPTPTPAPRPSSPAARSCHHHQHHRCHCHRAPCSHHHPQHHPALPLLLPPPPPRCCC
jgi:hypothetical protein